ncbi:hypothetical protein IC620_15210 [Hazenella sp. IB182357]|uniref:Uncharacterized protein n=1 Tax=Polycladospora coralii TaxID=2771432 RepID=A0A926RV20_9BACL|nr:hypothetical protein [Polycladospora coralii]MBD1373693.1 hypothetical protein [Polycladospora coralii]
MKNQVKDLIRNSLWESCILSSVAHAIMVAHYPEIAHERSWDGVNYKRQDSQGGRGTITFHSDYCVAAFRSESSIRYSMSRFKETENYLRGAPSNIINLAQTDAFQYLLEEKGSRIVPSITAAFSIIENKYYSTDSYDLMYQHGGYLLENELLDIQEAFDALTEEYEMTKDQSSLLWSIFKKKIANPNIEILLTKEEIDRIECDDPEGLEESRISFEEINIHFSN